MMGRAGIALVIAAVVAVGVGAVLGRRFHHYASRLYRRLRAGGARRRAAHRRRRSHVVWSGRVRRHRGLRDGVADDRAWRVAMARADFCARADRGRRGISRRHHASAWRTFSAARHHRLGFIDLFSVRQSGCAWPQQRDQRNTADYHRLDLVRTDPSDLLFDLGRACRRDVSGREPAWNREKGGPSAACAAAS